MFTRCHNDDLWAVEKYKYMELSSSTNSTTHLDLKQIIWNFYVFFLAYDYMNCNIKEKGGKNNEKRKMAGNFTIIILGIAIGKSNMCMYISAKKK